MYILYAHLSVRTYTYVLAIVAEC